MRNRHADVDRPADETGGEAENALRECDQALAADPLNAKLHRRKAKLLQRIGRAAEAAECWRAAATLRPDSGREQVPEAARDVFDQAMRAMREGRPADAEAALLSVVRQAPEWPEGWIALRGARWAQGRAADAEATAAEWLAAVPGAAESVAVAAGRPLSRRGWLVDPAERLPVVDMQDALVRLERGHELLSSSQDAYVLLHAGGAPVHHDAIVSVLDDGSDWFAIDTVTSPSFMAAFTNAVVIGRGLVITQQNTVVAETLTERVAKYKVRVHDRRLRLRSEAFPGGDLPVRVREQPALLMAGPTDRAFGDWVWRFPPRVTLLRELGLDLPLVVCTRLPSRFLEMLELLGYDRSRLIFHDAEGVSLFRKLLVPSWPTDDRLRPMKNWATVYEPLARQGMAWWNASQHGATRPGRPLLYLARTPGAARPLAHEAEIVELFRSRGFQIVYPERMSWREVLSTFACPAVVAGPFGSAFRNLAFCHEKPIALVMMPPCDEPFLRGVALWMAELGARVAYVPGQGLPVPDAADPKMAPWTVDLTRVESALDRVLQAAGRAVSA